ncbi:hypothetical protein [Aeromonas sp. FDAARGOS 1415]|uniref:hypothetical protein n=1 Tax=Aeromonas TaxID=642 RepID=UPI001C222584|nr:hypothetical protein [Aeromonas sp. FDAARGOS 1415]QXB55864.1 hypothetical protein I6L45_05865 [Aeromonas sp. FDAARGOS 1415]
MAQLREAGRFKALLLESQDGKTVLTLTLTLARLARDLPAGFFTLAATGIGLRQVAGRTLINRRLAPLAGPIFLDRL